MSQLESLLNPSQDGVYHHQGFLQPDELEAIGTELSDPTAVDWVDNHSQFVNKRNLTIVQNHDVYALKLSRGDQAPLARIPRVTEAAERVTKLIHKFGERIIALEDWRPDELTLHRYDDADVGLSFHKDNPRFIGVIAILSLEGVCDLVIKRGKTETPHTARPGDLMLLRAPGLVATSEDLRPEHAVLNLQTPTRTSLMLRANMEPDQKLPGFEFANWP